MCLLCGINWVFISEKTTFLIVTAVKASNLNAIPNLNEIYLVDSEKKRGEARRLLLIYCV
jgi:uncharacterized pyridoxamine 5'-phosphate oxidase family protein